MQRATICLTAVLALTITFFVSTTRAQHTGSAEISIDQLAFFAGHWSGDVVGGVAEEGWFAPSGGTMIGAFRVMQNNVTLFSEFFLIEESDEGIIFRFKHFNNDYTTWEDKKNQDPMELRLVSAESNTAVFEGINEHSPVLMRYKITDDGQLAMKVVTGMDEEGNEDAFEILYNRMN